MAENQFATQDEFNAYLTWKARRAQQQAQAQPPTPWQVAQQGPMLSASAFGDAPAIPAPMPSPTVASAVPVPMPPPEPVFTPPPVPIAGAQSTLTRGAPEGIGVPRAPRPEPERPSLSPWQMATQGAEDIGQPIGWIADRLGDLNTAARQVPGVAGIEDAAGAAYNAYTGTIPGQAEVFYGGLLRGETPNIFPSLSGLGMSAARGGSRLAREAMDQGLPGAWQQATERWQESPEPFPGAKGLAELTVPTELALGAIDPGHVAAGVRAGAKAGRAVVGAVPDVARAAGTLGRKLAAEKGAATKLGTALNTPPEVAGAVGGGVLGATTAPEDATLEERMQRGLYGAAAGGLAAAMLRRGRAPGGTIEDASKYVDDIVRQDTETRAALQEVEDQFLNVDLRIRGRETAGPTLQRPPNAGSLTNEQLEEVARAHNQNPNRTHWWESVDPEAFEELGPGRRSDKVISTSALRAERRELEKRHKDLTAELERLNQGYDKGYQEALERPPVGGALQGPAESALPSRGVPEIEPWTVPAQGLGQTDLPMTLPPNAASATSPAAPPSGGNIIPPAVAGGAVPPPKKPPVATGGPVTEPPIEPSQPRQAREPLWAGKTEAAGALERAPEPTRLVPPESEWQPTGRTPGGSDTAVPLGPRRSPYEQLQEALTPEKDTPIEWLGKGADKVMRSMYDRMWEAHKIEDATGIAAHKEAQRVPGAIAYGELLLEKQVDPVIKSVGRRDVKHLEEYMVAMRLQDILARSPEARLPGNIPGWQGALRTVDGLKRAIGPERFAKVESAAKELNRLNDELMLKPRVEAGLLDSTQYTQIKSANPHYISFYREDFTGLQSWMKKLTEANVTNAGIQEMELAGSVRKLSEPLARFRAQVIYTQHLIAENRAAKAITEGLVQMEKTDAGKRAAAVMPNTPGAAKNQLESGERFARLVKPGQKAEESNVWGTISYLDEGKRVTYQVPAQFAAMAKGLEAESANAWSRVVRAAAAPLRAGAVTFNVAFIPKNIIRDMASAFFREGTHPLSGDYVQGWMAALTHNKDYEDAARAGALMSGIVENMRSTNALSRAQMGAITVDNAQDALLLVPRIIGKGFRGIEKAGMVSEQATRIATFKKLRGQGLSELEAAVRARDATVDFAKAGHVMKLINQAVPFSNAGVQGAANTLRTMRYNPKQAIIGASPLVMTTMLAWANNQRFETAKTVPEREYAMNWVFVIGEGTKALDPKFPNKPPEKFPIYIRIPKGSIGGLLTAPAEMALRMADMNNDKSALNHFWDAAGVMATSLSPVEPGLSGITPPLAGTVIGAVTNYDAFRGQQIVPRAEQDRPPELQFGPETSREAVLLGEQFKVSPRLIDWAIKDTAAGVGSQTLWLSDMILGAVGYEPVPYGEAKRRPLSDTELAARSPFAGGFVGTQNTEEKNRGWDAFDNAVLASQRAAADNPELRRLGITFGPVGDTISLGKEGKIKLQLEPQERADVQQLTAEVLEQLAVELTGHPDYQKLPDYSRAKVISKVLDKGREAVRAGYLRRFSAEDLERRATESFPLAAAGGVR